MKIDSLFISDVHMGLKSSNCDKLFETLKRYKPKNIDGFTYINCGDWIENNSYVIFNNNKFELKYNE